MMRPRAARAAASPILSVPARRGLAILPQMPALSESFLKKERKLRAEAELAVRDQRLARLEAAKTPQFSRLERPSDVLRIY